MIVLYACQNAESEQVDGMIEPGEKIGSFLITAGEGGEATFGWEVDTACVNKGDQKVRLC